MSETERSEAVCTCTGLPQPEGPCAWCDVHGQPSAAWSQGIQNGVQQERVLSEMRQSVLRAERDEALGLLRELLADHYGDRNPNVLERLLYGAWVLLERADPEPHFELRVKDLRIDAYSPGAAVRIVHLPTGYQVTSSSEPSQLRNRAKCIRELTALVKRANRGGERDA